MASKTSDKTFNIGVADRINLRAVKDKSDNPGIMSRVFGYDKGNFIIIRGPRSSEEDAYIVDNFQEDFISVFFHTGIVYTFRTRIQSYLKKVGLILIDYPDEFLEKRVRLYPRIKVGIETVFRLQEKNRDLGDGLDFFRGNIFQGTMIDISEGGCCVHVSCDKYIPVEVNCAIDFSLPDGQEIEELEASILSSRMLDEGECEVGLKFEGPVGQMKKVYSFCQLAAVIQGLCD
jgi:hypothetical protein